MAAAAWPPGWLAAIDRGWRTLATALAFAVFALCTLLIGEIVAPPLRLASRDAATARRRVRRLVQMTCRGFLATLRGLGLIAYRIDQAQRLSQPGRLLLANHPTLIDALFLLAHTPDANCIVKGRLAAHPVTRGVIRAAGYVIASDPRATIAAARRALDNGQTLIVFPEGTRSTPGAPIRLRRGAATIALGGRTPILPVRIRCRPSTLTKGEAWYRVPSQRPGFHLEVGDVLSPRDTRAGETAEAIRELTRRLEAYFNDIDRDEEALHDDRAGTRAQAADH
ncbi:MULTISPECIES: lysophospholipid acyltransferase family protein [Modicisalibacter]|uniref:lysophospholipid acyltransferase family protein n=1 Tax=Modicisalibacter TaxID=574347 RepID=UPI00100B49E2|nr:MULTISPECIES: lysophospholipid acyltransferase family protein [Halomonadaceae]MBZ9559940.1 1-acyl-sn-glycerol-3-phosphate acyltransferase [Modicisalibacter sp. R2A 31.J]MBZ9575848.1 1-acyl-sn-glycerol-3-phosphate acyltransferase [Modicisalibacter sp. MOD 31.J]